MGEWADYWYESPGDAVYPEPKDARDLTAELRAERDRAREIAVALEQRLARVEVLAVEVNRRAALRRSGFEHERIEAQAYAWVETAVRAALGAHDA